MGVTVESHNIPQPVGTDNVPHNSQPEQQAAPVQPQVTAYGKFQPQRVKTAFEKYFPYAAAGLGSMTLLGMGTSYLKNKRNERIRRERDRQWRDDAKALLPVKKL